MKFEKLNTSDKRISPVIKTQPPVKSSCGCSDPGTISVSNNGALTPGRENDALTRYNYPFITGYVHTAAADLPVVSTVLSFRDKWETVKARISSFRMNYTLKPGLYAVGAPGQSSEVFVTANYKMSFDAVRASLNGINAWILVLDTNGINVWCAAGKGTFGTEELVKRISLVRLAEIVSHKKLIVPQLGAPGIDSGEVRRKSGFRVAYGPVRAEDLSAYVNNGYKCDAEMRSVRFDIIDRLILTPIELRQIFSKFPLFLLFVFIFFGLTPQGIIFRDSIVKGYPFIAAGLFSIFTGAFFTPVFLPFIPFRAFAVKGWVAGVVLFASLFYFADVFELYKIYLIISMMIIFPLLSSYMALQFTGASTYTSLSGVKREIKIAFPVYIAGAVLSFIFLILYKISDWGLI